MMAINITKASDDDWGTVRPGIWPNLHFWSYEFNRRSIVASHTDGVPGEIDFALI